MPDWLAILGAVLALAQMVYNVILGLYIRKWDAREREWQRRETDREKTDQRREQDLKEIRESCQERHQRIDTRCDERQKDTHQKEITSAVQFGRAVSELQRDFASKAELQEMREDIKQDLREIFSKVNRIAERQAAASGNGG